MIMFADVVLGLEEIPGERREMMGYFKRYLGDPSSAINCPPRAHDPRSRVQRPRWGYRPTLRPNQLYWPTGATRWGMFLGLAPASHKDDILEAVGDRSGVGNLVFGVNGAGSVTVTPSEDDVIRVDGASFNLNATWSSSMTLLPPIPASTHPDCFWIIPLVDERYWWQNRMMESQATSWQELIDEISVMLNVPLIRDTTEPINSAYGVPDPCVFKNGPIPVAAALDMVCWATNQRLVTTRRGWAPNTEYAEDEIVFHNGNAYECVSGGTSDASGGPSGTGTSIVDGTVSWDYQAIASHSYILRSVATADDLFERNQAAMQHIPSGNTWPETHNGDVPTEVQMLFGNGHELARLSDHAPAWAGGGGLPMSVAGPDVIPATPNAVLNAMATRWIDDWWEWSRNRFRMSYLGFVLDWHFTGYEDYAILFQSRTRNSLVTQTRLVSLPPHTFGWDFVPFQTPDAAELSCDAVETLINATVTGGCACCDCLDCVDLCEAPSPDVIEDCDQCPNGALRYYTAAIGLWEEWPELANNSGVITLEYDTGCTWVSEDIEPDAGGVYRWVLTQLGGLTSLALEHVSGADPLRLLGEYWAVSWTSTVSDSNWSCLCNMSMKINAPEKVPSPRGLNCTICLTPKISDATRPPGTCPPVEGVLPCVEDFDFPSLLFANGAENPLVFPFGFEGDTGVTFPMQWTINIEAPCSAVGGSIEPSTSGLNDPVLLTARLDYSAGTLYLECQFPVGMTFRTYAIDPLTLVLGDNTFTKQPLPPTVVDDSALVTWPDTVIVTLSDCRFGSTNPDLGYGCGGGAGTDCGGAGCRYFAFDSEGTQGGSVGPWTWGGCEGACPEGCTLPGPPGEPPTGPGDTYDVLCQPSE